MSEDRGPMGSEAILGSLLENERLAEVLAMGVPAFVRRAQRLEEETRRMFDEVGRERSSRLQVIFPEARRVEASRIAGAELPPAVTEALDILRTDAGYARRTAPPARNLDRTLRKLARRLSLFNRRWIEYVMSLRLARIHRVQRDYNKYYVLERECALRRAPPLPFRPVRLLRHEEILQRFPPLPEIEVL